ncbi:uncharacterized protein [Macrobrachium rosenbergii]|uniref:uncharacterized protein n=1 Tax=Macrobrachium rosenbergii TaxID=79674 RepID=UPI0034D5B6E6
MRSTTPICLSTVTMLLVSVTKETSGNLQVATDDSGLTLIASYKALAIIGILKLLIGILFLVDSELYFFKRKKRDLSEEREETEDKNLQQQQWLTSLLGCGLQLICDFQGHGNGVISEEELIQSIFGRKPETPLRPGSPDLPNPGYDDDPVWLRGSLIETCRRLFPRCPSSFRRVLEIFAPVPKRSSHYEL